MTDRINVKIENHPVVTAAVAGFGEYVKGEVLADGLVLASEVEGNRWSWGDEVMVGIEVSLN